MSEDYGQDKIVTLAFRDGVRQRPEMYIGTKTNEGIIQIFYEILSNANDEALNGFGEKIIITKEGHTLSVEDFGRGVPQGLREDGMETIEAVFTLPHTGGKFSEDSYKSSGGLNGIGAKATCLTSSNFKAISVRGGRKQTFIAEEGIPKEIIAEKCDEDEHGTFIQFTPSPEVFNLEPIVVDFERIKELCKTSSYLFPGVTYLLIDKDSKEEIVYKSSGIKDVLKDNITKPLNETILYDKVVEGSTEMEIALQWSEGKEKSWCFTNGLFMPDGGIPITGAKTAITRTLNSLLGTSLDGDQIRKGINYVISIKIAEPSFANQTKTAIGNPELRGMAGSAISNMIRLLFEAMPSEAKKVSDRILLEKKALEAADRAREAVLKNQDEVKKKNKGGQILAGKLFDCGVHDENSRIVLAEGESAAGNAVNARNSDNTAVLGLRGKIVNALKQPVEKVLNSDIIVEIQAALGCGIGENFDLKKLRYGHVGILADADFDGYSIMCLLLTFFYRYMPELILAEKVVWYRSPLYKVTTKSEKYYYAYSTEELDKLPKGEITRIKGIGELQAQDLADTTFSEDRSHLVTFTVEDALEAEEYFEIFMGTDVESRYDYIVENIDFSEIIE